MFKLKKNSRVDAAIGAAPKTIDAVLSKPRPNNILL